MSLEFKPRAQPIKGWVAALMTVLVLSVTGPAPAGAADSAAGGAAPLSDLQARGQKLFQAKCLPCHAPGIWGTNALARRMDRDKAELSRRTDLSVALVKTVMRRGVGSMPPIRRTEVPDADADAIAAYLTRNSTP